MTSCNRETLHGALAPICIDERTVVDTGATANHVLVREKARFPGKAHARLKVLLVDATPGFVLASIPACALAGKNQGALRLPIDASRGRLVGKVGIPD